MNAATKRVEGSGVRGKAVVRPGDGVEAVTVDDIETARAFARLPRPRRAARRVAWCRMRGDCRVADPQRFAVGDHANTLHTRKDSAIGNLRIVVGGRTRPQRTRAGRAGRDL